MKNDPKFILSLGLDTSKTEKEAVEKAFLSDQYLLDVRLSIMRASYDGLSLLIDAVIFNLVSSAVWDSIKQCTRN